MKVISETHRVL